MDMEAARVHALPEEGFYISDFITEDEEDLLLQKVLDCDLQLKQEKCANTGCVFCFVLFGIRLLLLLDHAGLISRIVVSKRILQL